MKKSAVSVLFYWASASAAAITLISFSAIIADVMIKGLPNINLSTFSPTYESSNLSILPSCVNTAFMAVFVMVLSLPVSVLTAVYLTEYSENKIFCKAVNAAIQTLASLPSIIYGLFGYLCFTVRMKMGFSFLSGAVTMSIMILPIMKL